MIKKVDYYSFMAGIMPTVCTAEVHAAAQISQQHDSAWLNLLGNKAKVISTICWSDG